ncbi:SAM-dependent methyltransferase [Halobacteriovorax marinus]|uniref:SAM-dependent methyltransferase n=1 Tax=Halobacteriovorax marinus TaxID=97084 RepID=A0A1Y5FHN7_9BACT|nr:SAM-dependent methyltransferase [Halobacteriovorax marinus]
MNLTTNENNKAKETHKSRMKLWDASIENRKQYINPETGLVKEEFIEQRACPVCSSADHLFMFNKEGGSYVKCKDCEMVFLNPVLTDSALNDLYTNNHDVQAEIVGEDSEFYTSIYKEGLGKIEKVVQNKGLIFDFGCSAGSFLDVAKECGWKKTWGIELNKSEFQVAKKKGHHVYNEMIQNIELPEKVDVVTLWDVFEHLKDGSFFLNLFKSILTKDGVVFLQIPNSMALAPRIIQEDCNMFDGLEHVNLYGPKTIEKLANDNGYEVVSMTTVIPETYVINNYLNYENPYLGDGQSKNDILSLIDDSQVLDNLLGYKIQVVLKPKL